MNILMEVLAKRSTMGSAIGAALFVGSVLALREQIHIREHSEIVLVIVGALCCLPGIDVIAKNIAAGGHAPTKADAHAARVRKLDREAEKHQAEMDVIRARAMVKGEA